MSGVAGLIDLHVHSSPDVRARYADDLGVARDAAGAGMAAILLKCHVLPTADRARIADDAVDGVRVFGGVVLNEPVGGLNPAAVRVALEIGGRCVWMPTEDAASHRRRAGGSGGLRVVDGLGRITQDVRRILDLVAAHDAILATGHLSVSETVRLVGEAVSAGVTRVLVNHPDAAQVAMPVDVQRELAAVGALMERCAVDTTDKPGRVPVHELAERIGEVGVASNVLTSDLGQAHNGRPVDGFGRFIGALRECGLSEKDVHRMAATNPAALLDLELEST
ncbi:DUF6282 family protein [Jiangella asiatica]|uniref:Histidinol phosphatase n=1 Tax=Jiangella asiatica TaxID=2530372 RepID=A0A4V2Z0I8_9ACTN|nr:DUF6282 family protein [Jiangella asiatica]TDE01148.1 hypothetical protein E1269_23585 [Jiangella asiatica]